MIDVENNSYKQLKSTSEYVADGYGDYVEDGYGDEESFRNIRYCISEKPL